MKAPTATGNAGSDTWVSVRRWLFLHRRAVSASLAFVAVLLGLLALTETPSQQPGTQPSAAAQRPALTDNQLAVPIRLSDPAVASLLAPGDVVDVMVADRGGLARFVAADLTVTAVPEAEGSGPWSDSDGLLMVAATADQALALAGATAAGAVTVAVHP